MEENIEIENRAELLSGIRTSDMKMYANKNGVLYILDRGEDAPDALQVKIENGELHVNRIEIVADFFDRDRHQYRPIVSARGSGGD